MERVQQGDVDLLAHLFNRYQKPLYRYFVHLTGDRAGSEDLVQDVFCRLLRFRHTFQRSHNFRSWMYQVARNAHIDHTRKHKNESRMPENPDGEVIDFPSPDSGPDESYGKQQEVALLGRALASMPEEKRELLVMSRFQDLRYDEIAEITQCEVGTVKVRIHRALKDLGSRFQALAGERAS